MTSFHLTARLNVISDMSQHQLACELAEWLDTNLPPLLRPANSVSVSVYEDVLIQERAA